MPGRTILDEKLILLLLGETGKTTLEKRQRAYRGRQMDKGQSTVNGVDKKQTTPYKGDKDNLLENGELQSDLQHDPSPPLLPDSDNKNRKCIGLPRGLAIIIISAVVFSASLTISLIINIYLAPPQIEPHGAVSCDEKRCSQIGVDLMLKGGNAVDASIGTLFCLSVVQPESSGLGGGGYLIYRDHANNKSTTASFREKAPADIDVNVINRGFDSVNPDEIGNFIGVPGALKGYFTAHEQFGKTSWRNVVSPSIDLARKGYELSYNSARVLGQVVNCSSNTPPHLTPIFCKPDGTLYQEGETIYRPDYAVFLERVADKGWRAMYEGATAMEIIDTVNNAGGHMTQQDLTDYHVIIEEPITSTYQGLAIESVGGGASGGVFALMLLNVLDLYLADPVTPADLYHYLIEAQKFAHAMGSTLGDPEFNPSMKQLIEYYISEEFASEVFNATDPQHVQPYSVYRDLIDDSWPYITRREATHAYANSVHAYAPITHTTHVSVIGPGEDFVSVTSSLTYYFGSELMTPSGIILNNALESFYKQAPDNANSAMGGKRPQSFSCPLVLYTRDRVCDLRGAIGAAGGHFIPADVATVLLHLIQVGFDLETSVLNSRLIQAYNEHKVYYSDNLEIGILEGLRNKGHNMTMSTGDSKVKPGAVNSALKFNETLEAQADPVRAIDLESTGEIIF